MITPKTPSPFVISTTKPTTSTGAESIACESVELWMNPMSFDDEERDLEGSLLLCLGDNAINGLKVTFLDFEVHTMLQTIRAAPATSMESSKRAQPRSDSARDTKRKKVGAVEEQEASNSS